MKVVIPERLFAVPTLGAPLTSLILGQIHDETGHRVLVAFDADPDALDGPYRRWLAGRSEDVRDAIELAMADWVVEESDPLVGGWPEGELRLTDGLGGWPGCHGQAVELPLAEARALLRQPFEVHVEDDRTDRAFLLAIAPEAYRALIASAERRGVLRFVNGGGVTNMKRRWQALEGDTSALARRRCRRMWAMFDRDGGCPLSGAATTQVQGLIDVAARLLGDAGYWCLERRSVESYLPADRMKAEAQRRGSVDVYAAWSKLPPAHQRAFNLKKGLRADRKHAQWCEWAPAWAKADTALERGIHPQCARVYLDGDLGHADFDDDARAEAQRHVARLARRL